VVDQGCSAVPYHDWKIVFLDRVPGSTSPPRPASPFAGSQVCDVLIRRIVRTETLCADKGLPLDEGLEKEGGELAN